jgi:hypothetical protein
MDDLNSAPIADGSADTAAEMISRIPQAEAYSDAEPVPASDRQPDGKFKAKDAEPVDEQVKDETETAKPEDDDDEYLEYEIAPEKEGEQARKERIKLSDAVEGYRKAQTLEAELAKARQIQPLPEDLEARTEELVRERSQYTQALTQWAQMNRPQPPNRELLNPQSPNWNPEAYYQQLQAHDEAVNNLQAIRQEVERNEALNMQQQKALYESRVSRELVKLKEVWPELVDKATADKAVADIKQSYGFTDQMINSITDHRFYALAKDALAFRAAQAAKKEAVKVVREKPKVVRATARTNTNSNAARVQSAFGKLQTSNSLDDAAGVIAAIRG